MYTNIWNAPEDIELNRCEYSIVVYFFACFVVFYIIVVSFVPFSKQTVWSILLAEEQQHDSVYHLPDVPTDEYLKNLPKDSQTFYCVICMETVPLNTVYTLNCDHQLCCGCARRLVSKYCPFCRNDISSSVMSKRKLEEVEKKFSQIEEDEEFARKLQSEINAEESDDDVVVVRTTTTRTTINSTTESIVSQKRSRRTKKGDSDSDDECKIVASKTIRFK